VFKLVPGWEIPPLGMGLVEEIHDVLARHVPDGSDQALVETGDLLEEAQNLCAEIVDLAQVLAAVVSEML
jgi:hypothetical protein